jgi:predicted anti-sigma-YlaC factor YlaD
VGCLFALFAAFTPRLALGALWIFTNLVDRAFSGFVIPLLGLIFLPYATLFYVLAWNPVNHVSGWGWFFVVIGVLFDLGHYTGGAYARGRRRGYATA